MTQDNINSRDELLTVEQEVALIKKIQQSPDDCQEATAKLLLGNRRFVRKIAQRFQKEGVQLPLEEIMAEGNKGLLVAAKRFDETQGYKFISYAIWFVKESIKQHINQN